MYMPCKFLFTYLNITNLKDSQCNVTNSATVIANFSRWTEITLLLRKCIIILCTEYYAVNKFYSILFQFHVPT